MLKFLKHSLFDFKTTGAVMASSKKLAELMIATANIEKARTIVELGPGTGVFTERILKQISRKAIFFALEINPSFLHETKKRCPSATIYLDSAINIRYYLRKHGVDGCDCIISGLPWAIFDRAEQEILIQTIEDALNPGGKFLTFAYIQTLLLPSGRRFRKIISKKFDETETTKIVFQNFPPAFVHICHKSVSAEKLSGHLEKPRYASPPSYLVTP